MTLTTSEISANSSSKGTQAWRSGRRKWKYSGAMASQGAQNFIFFIAVLSTAVGLLNLFPIPALDGGHLVFYAYEAVAGKPPSDRALRVLMGIGVTLILSLMIFALSNDLFC